MHIVVQAFFAFILFGGPARADVSRSHAPTLTLLRPSDSNVDLNGGLSVCEDPASRFDPQTIFTDFGAACLRSLPQGTPSFGYSNSSYWFPLVLTDQTPRAHRWLLELCNPMVDAFAVHRLQPDGTISTIRSGREVPLNDRPFPHRNPIVPLGVLDRPQETIWVRVHTNDVAFFPLRLVTEAAFTRTDHTEQFVHGAYHGILLMMLFFNLFLFAYGRDPTCLSYALTVFFYGLYFISVSGFGYEHFWPESVQWNYLSVPVSFSLGTLSGLDFSRRFLSFRVLAPQMDRLLWVPWLLACLPAVAALSGRFTLASQFASVVALLLAVVLPTMGFVALRRGHRSSRYYLLAGSFLFAGIGLHVLRNFNYLPSSAVTNYGPQLGSALHVVLMSVAVAASFRTLRREKEQAQRAAIEHAHGMLEAKLQALQAKVKPHFLFNSLNNIVGLISEDPPRAGQLVVHLSNLFRHTLNATDQDQVSLMEELAIVHSYLQIEQTRLGSRLSFEIRRIGDLSEITLPGLTLQPLVENSVKHGISPKVEGGKVVVEAAVELGNCHLIVEDDGVGMTMSRAHPGHGLSNVRERIRLAFGEKSEMTLSSENGLRIDIRFPIRIAG